MESNSSNRPTPVAIDVAFAAGAALVVIFLTAIAVEPGSKRPDLLAYLLASAIGTVLVWRRRYPVGVMVASVSLVVAYHALGYAAVGSLPLVFSLANASYYTAAVKASIAAALTVAGTLWWFLIGEQLALSEGINLLLREAAPLAAAILVGSVLRSRRMLREETQERIRLARVDEEARSTHRMIEERMAIAREIHDVVAHTVAVIGVQARVAADSLPESPNDAEEAVRIISDSTRDATGQLQATIAVLRGDEPSTGPAPGLDQLQTLVESVSATGVETELEVTGQSRRLSGLVELVAYRVVQEALTNVVRHSGATRALVEVGFGKEKLDVTVTDDGARGDIANGHGITGMGERVEAAGGQLTVGRSPGGGFRVMAVIPTGERP